MNSLNLVPHVEGLRNGRPRFFVMEENSGIVVAEASSLEDLEQLETSLMSIGTPRQLITEILQNADALLRTECLPAPPGWSEDQLSIFIGSVHYNVRANFHNYKPLYMRLSEINGLFTEFLDGLTDPEDPVAAFFFLRAHAAFMSAVGLALGTQLPEAYMVMRGCLESSLYGFKVFKDPDTASIWLSRGESEDSKKKCRSVFGSIKPILKALSDDSPDTANAAEHLYERTIDFGAHPNQQSIIGNMTHTQQDGGIQWTLQYLNPDSDALLLCLKSLAQIGVCVLKVFAPVFPLRYGEMGFLQKIEVVARGL